MSKAAYGQSMGTMCPALFTIRNYRFPADFIEPTTFPFNFQEENSFYRNCWIYL